MIRTLLVDDEPLARNRLRELLRDYDDFAVIGDARDGEEALRCIAGLHPDLVFLGVQLARVDGFEVARRLDPEHRPRIVFVTAVDRYALDTFRGSTVPHLLKPVERDGLRGAIARVREPDDAMDDFLAHLPKPRTFLQRVAVKSNGRTLLFRVEQVDWFESAGNYVRLHIGREHYLLRETMAGLDEKLDPAQFARIHRKAIVNLERIRELRPASHGEYLVLLGDDTRLTVSRVYRDRLDPLLGRA